ncbi:MAG: substrate-binding periplasmic protein [Halodesulfovibrio sp.]
MKRYAFLILLLLLVPLRVRAAELGEVIVVGPSWNKFTNHDGTGLYHEILDRIFTEHGVPLRRIYVSSQRGKLLVASDKADLMTCSDSATAPLFLARYPMYESEFHCFYNVLRHPEWKGPETLAGKSVVFRLTYYSAKNFPAGTVLKEVRTAEAALGMVLLGHADYYIDDLGFIKDSMNQSTIPFNADEYAIQVAGRRQYFPVFRDSERGRQLEAMYAEGMEKLHASGELRAIFDKWGFPYPHYAFPE